MALDTSSGQNGGSPAAPGNGPINDDDELEPEGEPEGEEGESDEEELFEFEDGGKKYHIPVALKDHLQRNGDYTRKLQKLAEDRRANEAERESAKSWRQTEETHQKALGQLTYLDEQLKEYEKIDWATWLQREPQRAQIAQAQMHQFERQRDKLRQAVDEGRKKHESDRTASVQQRVQAARDFAAEKIPGWNAELGTQLEQLALDAGMTAKEVVDFVSPATVQLLYWAKVGKQSLEARVKAKKAAAVEEEKPLVTIGRKRSAELRGSPTRRRSAIG